MKNKNLGDILISASLILLCGFFWMESADYAEEVRVFPRLFLLIIAITSLIVLLRATRRFINSQKAVAAEKAAGTYAEEPYDDEGTDLSPLAKQLLPFAGLLFVLIYCICIQYIGFFVSTAVFMLAFMRFLQMKKWWLMIAIAVGMDIVTYVLFVIVFAIRMPSGLLF